MPVPSAAQLLDVWEGALAESPTRRALRLLAAAHPELSEPELATLPIGQRDTRLLQLRERLFGSQLALVAPCPQCGQHIESQVRVGDLVVDVEESEETTYVVESRGYRVTFRLPASEDLIALPGDVEADDARAWLLGRCIVEAQDVQGQQKLVSQLSEAVLADIAMQMASTDPGADVELAFECPDCGHHWQEMFDIAAFFWRELRAWAQRTLRDVHVLARAYGWSEPDVLALSPTRRQIYLELCRQ